MVQVDFDAEYLWGYNISVIFNGFEKWMDFHLAFNRKKHEETT